MLFSTKSHLVVNSSKNIKNMLNKYRLKTSIHITVGSILYEKKSYSKYQGDKIVLNKISCNIGLILI